jgi:hypothetical protein
VLSTNGFYTTNGANCKIKHATCELVERIEMETWKAVIGAEERYVVGDYGNVRSLSHTVVRINGRRHPVKGRLLKPVIRTQRNNRGEPKRYRTVTIRFDDGRTTRPRGIGVLMLEAFVNPRPYPKAHARHLNDNSEDDRLENLAWGSAADNWRDADDNGRIPNQRGSNGGRAKLTETDVVTIRAAYAAGGVSQSELGRKYGVSKSAIRDILSGQNWSHVQQPGLTGKGALTAKATPIL